ncbi:LLM class flavin-dependent oxidoreductase [Chitinimonas sp. BJYL2]|uniref:LLM class flavin-dependent oxidoreductase n=1 Tax=Chitinimonas sp. BJYL2 TaxID=2976696 RepID=UPI0022B5CD44|nr:LLM class flavin-dependent oxidoreductase [Chitinimonas sp. BJYL2]
MSQPPRQLKLGVFFTRFGHHQSAWRQPEAPHAGNPDFAYWAKLALLAEQAKFDTVFIADFVGRSPKALHKQARSDKRYDFEPITFMSALAAITSRIGLVATVNTNFNEPYNVARKFASLDHISGGRAAWNVVSSLQDSAARSFGLDDTLSHAERYERAGEFLDLTRKLWDSWDDGAFDNANPATGQFFDPASAHPVDHTGKYFRSDSLLDVARPLQGYPVLVQAGNSDTGREFAAQYAEMTYASAQRLDVAQEYYRDVKSRLAKYGRAPEDIVITPGLSPIIGRTEEEAREKLQRLQDAVDFSNGVQLGGVDLSAYPLDGPVPDLPETENGKGRLQQLLDRARRDNLTIRQAVLQFSVFRGHNLVVGTASQVADVIEEWFNNEAADGFNLIPPQIPTGFEDFVRDVVPELQRRGLFRTEYTGTTLREHLGLRRPHSQHRLPQLRAA